MQVQCGRCAARYEFAAEDIPREGYEARCSQCEHEFFVAPPTDEPDIRHVQASLEQDREQYASGLSKRSTLDSLFEGDLHDAHEPRALPSGNTKRPASDEGFRPLPTEAAPPASDPSRSRGEDIEQEWAVAPLAPPGEPISARPPPPARRSTEAASPAHEPNAPDTRDAAAAYGRMRRSVHREGLSPAAASAQVALPRSRLVVGLGAALFVTLGVVVGVMQSNSLHTPTQVTPPVRIVRDPSPEARGAFDAGLKALADDTTARLRDAQQQFRRAIALDGEYTDAWAALALSSWLLGIDARDQEEADSAGQRAAIEQLAAHVQAQGRDASAVHIGNQAGRVSDAATGAALALAASSLRMRATVQDLRRLHERVNAERQDAWVDLHAAGAALVHAASLPVQTPLLATTMALWLSDMPDGGALVLQQLSTAEQLVGQVVAPERRSWSGPEPEAGDTPPVERAAPWAAWRLMARGRLALTHAGDDGLHDAIAAFEGALRLEPGLRRAQMALAEALVRAKRERDAAPILKRLSQQTPPHERARALQAAIER